MNHVTAVLGNARWAGGTVIDNQGTLTAKVVSSTLFSAKKNPTDRNSALRGKELEYSSHVDMKEMPPGARP